MLVAARCLAEPHDALNNTRCRSAAAMPCVCEWKDSLVDARCQCKVVGLTAARFICLVHLLSGLVAAAAALGATAATTVAVCRMALNTAAALHYGAYTVHRGLGRERECTLCFSGLVDGHARGGVADLAPPQATTTNERTRRGLSLN